MFVCLLAFVPKVVRAETPARSTHYLVALHGIGHGVADFGSLQQALETSQPQIGTQLKVIYFKYDTSPDAQTIADLKVQFKNFLKTELWKWQQSNSEELGLSQNANFQISFLGYSLGGLILQEALLDEDFFTWFPRSALRNIFLVANPYWGSLIANWGTTLKPLIGEIPFYSVFGKTLLQELSLNSQANSLRLRLAHDTKTQQRLQDIFSQTSVIQIAGITNPERFPFPALADAIPYIESDIAVPVSHAQWNHRYFIEDVSRSFISAEQFQSLQLPYEFYLVDGTHLPAAKHFLDKPWRDLLNLNYISLMEVDPNCVNDVEHCPQEVYKIIYHQFANTKSSQIANRLVNTSVPTHLKSNSIQSYQEQKATALTISKQGMSNLSVPTPVLNRLTVQLELLSDPDSQGSGHKYQVIFDNPSFALVDSSSSSKGHSFYFVGQALPFANLTSPAFFQYTSIKSLNENSGISILGLTKEIHFEKMYVQLVDANGKILKKKTIEIPMEPGILNFIRISL